MVVTVPTSSHSTLTLDTPSVYQPAFLFRLEAVVKLFPAALAVDTAFRIWRPSAMAALCESVWYISYILTAAIARAQWE